MIHEYHFVKSKKWNVTGFFESFYFRFLLLGVLSVFLVLNVIKIASISTKGYEISHLQKQIEESHRENERVLVQISEINSMQYLEQKIAGLPFVKVENPEYITVHGFRMVQR